MPNVYYTLNKLGAEGTREIVCPLQPVRLRMPFSEVCMHLRVAGEYRDVVLNVKYEEGFERASAAILKEGWTDLSDEWTIPITTGEAGILTDRVRGA